MTNYLAKAVQHFEAAQKAEARAAALGMSTLTRDRDRGLDLLRNAEVLTGLANTALLLAAAMADQGELDAAVWDGRGLVNDGSGKPAIGGNDWS